MIECQKCGKENQDHYKFCLGCGAELKKPVKNSVAPAAAANSEPPATYNCPQCSHSNTVGNRFCAGCGYNLLESVAPAATQGQSASAGIDETTRISLTALRADGTESGTFELPEKASVTIGRDTGSVFAGDSYLSPKHATLDRVDGKFIVRDCDSLNGVYLKLTPNHPWPIGFGDVFRIGQEIIRYEELRKPAGGESVNRLGSPGGGYLGRLALIIGRDSTGNAFPVPENGVHCGRERGDILFSEDGYVSGLHCRVAPGSDGKMTLTDVGSSNGTFVRLRSEYSLTNGDVMLMGQQLFRVDIG